MKESNTISVEVECNILCRIPYYIYAGKEITSHPQLGSLAYGGIAKKIPERKARGFIIERV